MPLTFITGSRSIAPQSLTERNQMDLTHKLALLAECQELILAAAMAGLAARAAAANGNALLLPQAG